MLKRRTNTPAPLGSSVDNEQARQKQAHLALMAHLEAGPRLKTNAWKHGWTKTKTHSIWCNMRERCRNKSSMAYHNYGGRGIKVCKEWDESFLAFLKDMGPCPTAESSIERVDNDKGYCKANCTWIKKSDQSKNRRSCRKFKFNGMAFNTLSSLASFAGMPEATLYNRLNALNGDVDTAVTRPKDLGRLLTYKGKTRSIRGWAREKNMLDGTLRFRLNKLNWTITRAIETPLRRRARA